MKDKVTIWRMTIQSASSRKLYPLVRVELSLGRDKDWERISCSECKRWDDEVCVSRELCIELQWRRGNSLPWSWVVWNLHMSLSRCRVSKEEFVASWSSLGSVSHQWEGRTEMAHWHFCVRATSLGEWKATRSTSLLQESRMFPLHYGLKWLLVSTKATEEIPQALTGTCLWFPRSKAHVLLKHFRKIK